MLGRWNFRGFSSQGKIWQETLISLESSLVRILVLHENYSELKTLPTSLERGKTQLESYIYSRILMENFLSSIFIQK